MPVTVHAGRGGTNVSDHDGEPMGTLGTIALLIAGLICAAVLLTLGCRVIF